MEIESRSKTDIDKIKQQLENARRFYTIREMAKTFGVTEDYISMMLNGVRPLNAKWRSRFTDYLNKYAIQNETASAFNSR